MKTCAKCGYVDYKPDKKCPKCGDKYSGYSCNPLSGSAQDSEASDTNGFHTPFELTGRQGGERT